MEPYKSLRSDISNGYEYYRAHEAERTGRWSRRKYRVAMQELETISRLRAHSDL